jgi:hypothetical protein
MDETYRRFHSGRFGPVDMINPDFNMQEGGSVASTGKKKKKTEDTEAGSGPEPGSAADQAGYADGGY